MPTNNKANEWKEYHKKLCEYNGKMKAYEKLVKKYATSFNEDGETELDPPPPPPENPPPPPNP